MAFTVTANTSTGFSITLGVVSPTGNLKVWSGTEWVPVKVWSGSEWVYAKFWDGSSWF